MTVRGPPAEEVDCKLETAEEIDALALPHADKLMHCDSVVARATFEWDHRRVERVVANKNGYHLVQKRYYHRDELTHVVETTAPRSRA